MKGRYPPSGIATENKLSQMERIISQSLFFRGYVNFTDCKKAWTYRIIKMMMLKSWGDVEHLAWIIWNLYNKHSRSLTTWKCQTFQWKKDLASNEQKPKKERKQQSSATSCETAPPHSSKLTLAPILLIRNATHQVEMQCGLVIFHATQQNNPQKIT